MKQNITQKEINEKEVKKASQATSPKQSTLEFIMQFARSCSSMNGCLPAGLNVISAN